MHLTLNEAISLLNTWASARTTLRVHFSRPGAAPVELRARLLPVEGDTVKIDCESEVQEISLQGAEFNGDNRATSGAYLICEFRNDDRWAFHAPRQMNR